MPARSQPSKRGSSPAILEMSMAAKSMTPRRSSRSMVASAIPIWSSGVMSAVSAPLETLGSVSRQNGTSSRNETTVGLFRPITLKCAFGRSCACAEITKASAASDPSASVPSERVSIGISPVKRHNTPARLAADIGGTFTDVVLERGGRRHSAKVLTTPRAPEEGMLEGIARVLAEAALPPSEIGVLIHGTTLATNALIERKGARTALLTTEGFRDVLEMGYEKRYEHYDLQLELPAPLVPRGLRVPVEERVTAKGQVRTAWNEKLFSESVSQIKASRVGAVASTTLPRRA